MIVSKRRNMVVRGHGELSIVRQCGLLGLHRSGWYYTPKTETPLNLELMRIIDAQYMRTPYYGVARMAAHLKHKGYEVNKKCIRRLYRKMGLEAIYPKANLSNPDKSAQVYPYLLSGMEIMRPNQVWGIDITCIPMQSGFLYLVALIDLYSRFTVTWSLSNSMEAEWCAEAVKMATRQHGIPEIINSDQGSQFTSGIYIDFLKQENIQISMDGKGRAIDNIFIERLWRSVKYEYVYLNPADDGLQLYQGLSAYFQHYNYERVHQGIGYLVPQQLYQQE